MKNRHIHIPLILLIFTFSGLCSITTTAEAQEVHALLIIIGDRDIGNGVDKNRALIMNMLKQLSDDCTVKLTLMKSKDDYQGEIARITYINQKNRGQKTTQQGIIESWQVAKWLANLRPKPEDTVFIYYTGHGEIDPFGTHELIFDPGVKDDTPDRAKLSQQLKEKRARLRMLITDTCSSPSRDLPESALKPLAGVRERKRPNYPSDLFLKHEGFLDITAASPGQFAIVHNDLGGHFTIALLAHGFTAAADTNNDDFLSWQETFKKTKAQTKLLYGQAEFDDEINADLRENRQTTQTPTAHELPRAQLTGTLTVPGIPSITTETLIFPKSYSPVIVSNGGTISGTVRVKGVMPAMKMLEITADQAVCGQTPKFDETLVVGENNALQNTIVYLTDISQGKNFNETVRPEINQHGCKFTPHIQIVPVGARLLMVNTDKIMHNVHVFSKINAPVNKAMSKARRKMPLAAAKRAEGPVQLKCDIHEWMSAWIAYVPHPYFAVTDEKGQFTLENVPPGTYKLGYWHEACGTNNDAPAFVTVRARQRVTHDFTLSLKN